jgi:hypothetical protein
MAGSSPSPAAAARRASLRDEAVAAVNREADEAAARRRASLEDRAAREANKARYRRSSSFRENSVKLSPLEQLHLPIGFASVPPSRSSRSSLGSDPTVAVDTRKQIIASECVAKGVRTPGMRDGTVLVAGGQSSPRAAKLFRVMRGDFLKRPWDGDPHLLPDLIKQDREPWEARAASCQARVQELKAAAAAKALYELGRDDRRRAKGARAHVDQKILSMVALGARCVTLRAHLLLERRAAAEERAAAEAAQDGCVAAAPPPKKPTRGALRRQAADALLGESATKLTRWWLGLRVRWLFGGLSAAQRARVARTVTKITQKLIAKYRKTINRKHVDVVHHFLVRADACQGKRGIAKLIRKIKLGQQLVRGWVRTRQARVLALDVAFRREERRFQHFLNEQRVAVEVSSIRRTERDPKFYQKAQALADADARLQHLLTLEGNSVVARVLRRAEATEDPEAPIDAEDDPYAHTVYSETDRKRTVEEVLLQMRGRHWRHAVTAYKKYCAKCHEVHAEDVKALLAKRFITKQDTVDVLMRPAERVPRYPLFRPLTGPHNALEAMQVELHRVHAWRHPPRHQRSKRKRAARVIQARWRGVELTEKIDRDALEAVFKEFCAVYRSADMNNTIWAKLCRETKGLLDKKKFTRDSGIDMIWTRCAGAKKNIGSPTFKKMLREVAVLKEIELFALEELIVTNAKVKRSGTKAQEKKFYEVPQPKTTKDV